MMTIDHDLLLAARRIMIVGGPGAGKSTLATLLGERLGLPVYRVDHLIWAPDWTERDLDTRTREALEIEALDAWIFEGGGAATFDNRLARADVLIWLDAPAAVRIWRLIRRAWRWRGRARPDMAEGCEERLNADWLGFLKWAWDTRRQREDECAALMARAGGKGLRLSSLAEINRFVARVQRRSAA